MYYYVKAAARSHFYQFLFGVYYTHCIEGKKKQLIKYSEHYY